jgi:lysophospholipase L1-like esterase
VTASACWAHKADPNNPGPEYDQFNPIIGSHCLGTNHQDITGIEKVVFLGDSVTAGTPPTPMSQYYRTILTGLLEDEFGQLEVVNKAEWGARTDDLLLPSKQQIIEAFPVLPEPKTTLVVMTVGGNDFFKMAETHNAGGTAEEIMLMAEEMVQLLEDAIHWFVDDPTKFPNGVFVIFSNVFEYTDATGNMSACPSCLIVGLCGDWPEGRAPAIFINEAYMRIAVETGTDMVFMLEHFCGHGWESDNPESQCYLGPDTPRWIDITCIHPTPEGHQAIVDMFWSVIQE